MPKPLFEYDVRYHGSLTVVAPDQDTAMDHAYEILPIEAEIEITATGPHDPAGGDRSETT